MNHNPIDIQLGKAQQNFSAPKSLTLVCSMKSAVENTICQTAHSLPRPSLLHLRMRASHLPRLRTPHPVWVRTLAATPTTVVTISVPPRWTFLRRGPTSSPCTGVLRLYFLLPPDYFHEHSVIHDWNDLLNVMSRLSSDHGAMGL